ncbi:DLW-39 family protein [Nesterenkonia sp.]|nr:DLW-39 family protein [Nesterenkonia sp.]
MKRLLLTAAAVAGFLAYREWKRSEETRQVWDQATDSVRS